MRMRILWEEYKSCSTKGSSPWLSLHHFGIGIDLLPFLWATPSQNPTFVFHINCILIWLNWIEFREKINKNSAKDFYLIFNNIIAQLLLVNVYVLKFVMKSHGISWNTIFLNSKIFSKTFFH